MGLALVAGGTASTSTARAEPTALEVCYQSEGCRLYGLCWPQSGRCAVHPSCREACRSSGRCFFDGERCVALTSAACAWSEACRGDDQCVLDEAEHRCDDGRERNNGLMVTGIVSLGLGGLGVIYGLVMQLPFGDNDCAKGFCAGDALAIAGGALLVVGLPMTIAGAARVPRQPRTSSLVPEVAIGPLQGQLAWRF